jgi:hypothetical protein
MARTALLLTLLLGLAALAGCNSSSTLSPGVTTLAGDAAVVGVVRLDESADPAAAGVIGGDTAPDEWVDSEPGRAAGFAGVAEILPDTSRILWWRKVTSYETNITRSGTADSVLVSALRTNTGLFKGRLHLKGRRDTLVYEKPYAMNWTRTAVFVKGVADSGEEGTRWVLRSISLASGVQVPVIATTPVIRSVVVSGNVGGTPTSVTFDDPGKLYDAASLPRFDIGDSVSVRVFTDGTDAGQLAYIHFDRNGDDRGRAWRRPLAFNSATGAFEGSFRVREGFGKGHKKQLRPRSAVWVDVLSRDTIYDTTAPYAATCWGLPYRLVRRGGHDLAMN